MISKIVPRKNFKRNLAVTKQHLNNKRFQNFFLFEKVIPQIILNVIK